MAAYALLKPSFARRAKETLPRSVFNSHPAFTTIGSRLLKWSDDERQMWAAQIIRHADAPTKLPDVISAAAREAEASLNGKG
jgi:hypothetical protein